MTERPILMKGRTVRSILEGEINEIRRVITPQPPDEPGFYVQNGEAYVLGPDDTTTKCLYGVPGDILWVRETHAFETTYDLERANAFQDRPRKIESHPDDGTRYVVPHYRATEPEPHIVPPGAEDDETKWSPSIHMPRWACRIFLQVTDVRAERLQEEDVDVEQWNEANEGFEVEEHPWVWVVKFSRAGQQGVGE